MNQEQTSSLFGAVVKQALTTGTPVEVDGLGVFVLTNGALRFIADVAPRVFVAYVYEDRAYAMRLANALEGAGMKSWLDCRKLRPGQNWPGAIERAIETSDFFVPCVSKRALRKRGQFPYELRLAMRCAERMPLEQNFIAPVRIDSCDVPAAIQSKIQYVDLFPEWDAGAIRLIDSLWHEFAARTG